MLTVKIQARNKKHISIEQLAYFNIDSHSVEYPKGRLTVLNPSYFRLSLHRLFLSVSFSLMVIANVI